MTPWVLLETAPIPGSTNALRLLQRGTEFLIRINTDELMNSRLSGSEEALATLTCGRLAGKAGSTVLIGGLGMGFTLRAALATLGTDASVVVSELVPAVVAWARGPMAALFGTSLTDRRVRVLETDVAHLIRERRGAYDVILLDVDNGPEGLTHLGNDWLYSPGGLAAARDALKTNGLLGVWSARRSIPFTHRLERAGFAVEEKRVRANRGRRGATHTIWIATRPA